MRQSSFRKIRREDYEMFRQNFNRFFIIKLKVEQLNHVMKSLRSCMFAYANLDLEQTRSWIG